MSKLGDYEDNLFGKIVCLGKLACVEFFGYWACLGRELKGNHVSFYVGLHSNETLVYLPPTHHGDF